MAAPAKPPITCHALDTTLGKPATHIPVTLTLANPPSSLSSQPLTFKGVTNDDGRVLAWENTSPFSQDSVGDVFRAEGDQQWRLVFDTQEYFGKRGIEAFFPEVQVGFLVREKLKGEHFHVPVLLGPFGYTTYRGS